MILWGFHKIIIACAKSFVKVERLSVYLNRLRKKFKII